MTVAPISAAEADRLRSRPPLRGVPRLPERALAQAARIGTGRAALDRAADILLSWEMHARSGLGVAASHPQVVPEAVVRLAFRLPVGTLYAPCEVTDVWRDDERAGFSYRTLAGHPEQGTESFDLTMGPAADVTFTVTAMSRPGTWLTIVGLPVMRVVQRRITGRYLHAFDS